MVSSGYFLREKNSKRLGGGKMNILIAADSFKGSLSSLEVGEAIASGVRKVDSEANIEIVPLADGGEGTVEAILYANDGTVEEVEVNGPLMDPVKAQIGVFNFDGTQHAVLECAESTGLTLVPAHLRNPMAANSFGLGEQIKYAIQKGYKNIVVTLGGSATTDGGTGMLQALGWEFYDQNGNLIVPSKGNALLQMKDFSNKNEVPELKECKITIASDVSNPFYGPNGAAFVYAGQKGANLEQIKELDYHLEQFANLITEKLGIDVQEIPGAGAAGGLGGALSACLGANMQSGIELVLQYTEVAEKIKRADIIFTGEGSLDKQSLYGKGPIGVAKLAKEHKKK